MIGLFRRGKRVVHRYAQMKPGDPHHRAFVGPPADYDLVAAMSFSLLTTLGLRQHHCLLDIGCGSLRIGRLLIPYLDPGHYVGVEPNEWLVREGISQEVGRDQLRLKEPRFFFADGPEILPENLAFDFALAQSIFSHCTPELMDRWLKGLFRHLHADAALAATFKQGPVDFFHEKGIADGDFQGEGWVYPKCVTYRVETIAAAAERNGYCFQVLDWMHPRQTWALFSREGFDTAWFAREPLAWNTYCQSLMGRRDAKANG